MTVTLYTTAGCHLCELALAQLQNLQKTQRIEVRSVEIGDDDDLVERYGIRIPVIQCVNQQELDWPFALPELKAFLQVNCAEL
ncbi:MAG: glutaredoxin family protein [Methylophaga sp.]|nr:glutaredoxin family protein [Methylophaga sp.]